MRLLLLGGPVAGKGTQAAPIAAHFELTHVPRGDLLRRQVAQQTRAGRAARSFMDRGDLVPDDIVIEVLWQPLIDAYATGRYVRDSDSHRRRSSCWRCSSPSASSWP
jgi:adenylate kinase family enzyme